MRYIDENRKYWDSNAQTYIDAHPEFNNENLFPHGEYGIGVNQS